MSDIALASAEPGTGDSAAPQRRRLSSLVDGWPARWRRLAGLSARHAWLVIGMWVAVAGVLNIAVPQLEQVVADGSAPFIPDSAPSLVTLSHMGAAFGESPATAVGYIVFEDTDGISEADRRFVDMLLARIGAQRSDIDSVQNLGADPATAPIATSTDGQAMYAVVRFHGGMGSAPARRGQVFVASAIADSAAPAGLAIHLSGPAPTVGDELATEDHTVLLITVLSVVMIVALLLLVYRSVSTIVIPLAAVGLALGVARPVVALLGAHAGLDVSIFSVMLLAALILGGGSDYAIFLINGYHAARLHGRDWDESVADSMQRTASVIVASGLTVAASCAVMAGTNVVLFRTAGLPCSLGMLVTVAASLTLVPALMALLARRGRLEPRASSGAAGARWRRLGVFVIRRPLFTLLASAAVLVVLAAQVPRMTSGYDERAMQPPTTMSNQGYAAIARHFDPNELTPDYLLIDAHHDLRTPEGFSALNIAARAAAGVPGVKLVRGVTQPQGSTIPEFTLAGQNRLLAQRLGDALSQLRQSLPQLDRLRMGTGRLDDGMVQLSTGAAAATAGSGQISGGADTLRGGLAAASASSDQLAQGADKLASGSQELADSVEASAVPLFSMLNTISPAGPCPDGNCDSAGLDVLASDHSLLGQIRYQLSRLKSGSRQLADGNTALAIGTRALRDGLTAAAHGSASLATGQALLTTKLAELSGGSAAARRGSEQLTAAVAQVGPQIQQLIDGLAQAQNVLAASGAVNGRDAGFYVPTSAFTDARLAPVLGYFVSADGTSARLIVVNEKSAYDASAVGHLGALTASVRGALAGTSLHDAEVSATGLAAGFADLHDFVMRDFMVIAACALLFIAVILALLLRALLAPLYMLLTIAVSYAAALGLTVLIWQDICGIDIYWAVPALAFVALVSVGSDYNILVMSRIRDESTDSVKDGIVQAMATTGGVVSTAGVIFAVTMLAMLASPTHSIGQVGSTIGAGLLLDTFVVRALTVPAIASLLGRANWWPARNHRSPRSSSITAREREGLSTSVA